MWFHVYGLILGLAISLGWWLAQKKATQLKLSASDFESVAIWTIVGGIIGARLYHVATDWSWYQHHLVAILYIWQGGLSIIGAVLGGLIAAVIKLRWRPTSLKLSQILDLSVFGLPGAQALGRLGNWFNQELYGYPTSLPWGIHINPERRLPGMETAERFHPLFAYEAVGMMAFGIIVWWLEARWRRQPRGIRVGQGWFFIVYVMYYSVLRFLLDFLRPDKAQFFGTSLGLNQVVLLGVMMVGSVYIGWRWLKTSNP